MKKMEEKKKLFMIRMLAIVMLILLLLGVYLGYKAYTVPLEQEAFYEFACVIDIFVGLFIALITIGLMSTIKDIDKKL